MKDIDFVTAASYYNAKLSSGETKFKAFGFMPVPGSPTLLCIALLSIASWVEAVYGTLFILPIVMILISDEILHLGRLRYSILWSCIEDEMDIGNVDRDMILNRNLSDLRHNKGNFSDRMKSSIKAIIIFFIVYIINMSIYSLI